MAYRRLIFEFLATVRFGAHIGKDAIVRRPCDSPLRAILGGRSRGREHRKLRHTSGQRPPLGIGVGARRSSARLGGAAHSRIALSSILTIRILVVGVGIKAIGQSPFGLG